MSPNGDYVSDTANPPKGLEGDGLLIFLKGCKTRLSITWGVLRIGLVAADQESGMKWRILVEVASADGSVQSHEISVGGGGTIVSPAETLGLTLAEGKKTLAGLQRHLVQAQTEEHCRTRRRCQRCGRNGR